MDKIVTKLVALGVPGLVLLFVIGTTGLAGGAAIVTALALLGGPFGMMGGIAMMGVMTLVSAAVAEYGLKAIFKRVVSGLVEKGTPKSEIRRTIQGYPITSGLKKTIQEHLDNA